MLVDDDDGFRAIARAVLIADGLRVVADTSDPCDALARWRDVRPDVIVLDEVMDDLSGLQLAGRVLRDDPEQPIIMLTADATRGLVAAAAMAGIYDVLAKVDLAELSDVVRKVFVARAMHQLEEDR